MKGPNTFLLAILFFFLVGVRFFCLAPSAFALVENLPIHFSGDRQVWDRRANRVELFGHGAVSQPDETLTADYIILDLNKRTLDARGNCVYVASDSVITGEEMHFNLDTHTGNISKGLVTNESFTLRGEKISRLGQGRFRLYDADYTTCRDCDPSWSLQSSQVDMQVNGYAYLSNVVTRIKDMPTFWLPYMIVPMKTSRQSGLLFPKLKFGGAHGAQLVARFFWDINPSADMTFGLGQFTKRGMRAEWEGRYALTNRSGAQANFYYINDSTFDISPNRWAVDLSQTQELPWKIDAKLRLSEVSDNLYPFYFGDDLPRAGGEAFLPSSLILSRNTSSWSAFFSLQRYRNLLSTYSLDPNQRQLETDPRTVQALPSLFFTTNDQFIADTPLVWGMSLGFTNFTRASGSFDFDLGRVPYGTLPPSGTQPLLGVDPIRKATRFSLTPSVYTTLRPFDEVSLIPSVQYRAFYYNFGGVAPDLYRSYLLFQVDLSAQLEKIYEFPDDPDVPRTKHLIRPMLTYSFIPYISEDTSHPFVQQIKQTNRPSFTPGYNFDDHDIIPYGYQNTSANFFVPLGHSLAYGLTSQWTRRRGAINLDTPSYQTVLEVSAGSSINFLELSNKVDPHVFSRFFTTATMNYDSFLSQTTYYYYPDIFPVANRHVVITSGTYIFERGVRQRILTFDRSLTLGYTFSQINGTTSNLNGLLNFSINDYLLPFASFSYGFAPIGTLYNASVGLHLQSPSQCWKFTTSLGYQMQLGTNINFDLSLNLTGKGFGGVTDFANSVQNVTR